MKKRTIEIMTKRILSIVTAVILTAGTVCIPVAAAGDDPAVADANVTQVSEYSDDIVPETESEDVTDPEDVSSSDADMVEDMSSVETSDETAADESSEFDEVNEEGSDDEGTDENAEPDTEEPAEDVSEPSDETLAEDEISEVSDDIPELLGDKIPFLNNKSAYWDLTPEGKLTISGTGKVDDYAYQQIVGNDPDCVTQIVINDGITALGKYSFSSLPQVTEINLPTSLTSMGESCFQSCVSLNKITIPNGIAEIPKQAFYDCTALSGVTLSNKLTKIGNDAFASCSNLKQITFPASLKEIDQGAFSSSGLEGDLILPDHLDSIEMIAFNSCQGLKCVYINSELSSVSSSAFSNCQNLKTAYLADGIKSVPENMFSGCEYLEDVHLPEGLTLIGASAFRNCVGLKNLTLPSSLVTIEDKALEGCSGIDYLLLPTGIKTIGNGVFRLWSNSADIYFDGTKDQWKKVTRGTENHVLDNIRLIDPVTALTLDKSIAHLFAGNEEPFTLTATITPADAGIADVEFTSDASDKVSFAAGDGEYSEFIRTKAVNGVAAVSVKVEAGVKDPVTITARSVSGGCKAVCSVNVIRPTSIRLNRNSLTLDVGESYVLSASILPDGVNSNVFYEVSDADPSYATDTVSLSDIGEGKVRVTAIKADERPCRIFARAGDARPDVSVSDTCMVTVTASDVDPEGDTPYVSDESTDGIWVSGIEPTLPYTGSKVVQDSDKIKVFYGNKRLTEKTDYTISYKNNLNAAVYDPASIDPKKTPTMTVTLKGQYTGAKSYYFTILKASINSEDIKVYEPAAVANGKEQRLVPEVTFKGNKLKNGRDFEVIYIAGTGAYKTVGEYPIQIRGLGNFTDETPTDDGCYYEHITAKDMNLAKASMTVKPAEGAKKYYYDGGPFTSSDVEVTVKLAGDPVDKKYYKVNVIPPEGAFTGKAVVWIEASPVGIDAGYRGIRKTTVTVVPDRQIKNAVTDPGVWLAEITYNPYKPMVQPDGILTYGEGTDKTVLKEGTDYTVSYSKNKKVGKATATIKGIGRYSGTVKKSFAIKPNSTVYNKGTSQAEYTKGGVKPGVILYDISPGMTEVNRYTLREKIDYTVTIVSKSNQKPGVMTYKITGKGNYKGYIKEGVETSTTVINGKLDRLKMTVNDVVFTTRANKWKSKVTITDTNGKKLKAGTDYDKNLVYWFEGMSDTVTVPDPGTTVYVTAMGKGYYAGTSLVGTYRICEQNISSLGVVIDLQTYTGREVELSADAIHIYPSAKDARARTEEITDDSSCYRIIGYSNNVKSGKARVTLKGVGAYGGEKTYTFKIDKKAY